MRPPRLPGSSAVVSNRRRGRGFEGEPAPHQVPPADVAGDDQPRHLVSPEEAARRLSIGHSNLYRLMARGELPSVRIGRLRRLAIQDLDEYVRRLRFTAGTF